jgi:ABC-type transport system involved in multi-copper enzyme maturation permease subunit
MFLADSNLYDRFIAKGILLAIVLVAILVMGIPELIRDIRRFSWTRIWAISGVCFQESIRRRVLWITPLTIVGVIVAVQLLNPIDEQDAIRQTIKYSLFATATLVVMVTIILACTSLPKEIDNRVIFTIVTKPTTRLEIVLGKIVGFARVSATLLIIMGVFTLVYAQIRASQMRSSAQIRLENLSPTDSSRSTLEHYARYGLLQSKTYARPVDFQQFARVPNPTDPIRWISGNEEESFLVGFDLPPEMFPDPSTGQDNGGLVVRGKIACEYYDGHPDWRPIPFPGGDDAQIARGKMKLEFSPWPKDWHPTPFPGEIPEQRFSLKPRAYPTVELDILGPDKFNLIPPTELPGGGAVGLALDKPNEFQDLITLAAQSLDRLYQQPQNNRRIYVKILGYGPIRYGASPNTVRLFSPRLQSLGKTGIIEPIKDPDGKLAWPVFRGREIMGGQQLRGGADLAQVATGVFSFRDIPLPPAADQLPVELRLGIEGSGDEVSAQESLTEAVIQVLNKKTGQMFEVPKFAIESNRTAFFSIPAAAVSGGDFDVHLRCLGPGHYLVLRGAGAAGVLQLVTGQEAFALNLFKSLLVMWLMSLLVVIISIFCSTFVSWPIAVVLTIVILLGHWGAMQIGDSNAPGMGAQVAKDMFGLRDPASMKTVSSAVDNLSRALNVIAKVLPDISQFSATEDIERGVTIAPRVLLASFKVIVYFGLPLMVLAYVFLKRKEVAP